MNFSLAAFIHFQVGDTYINLSPLSMNSFGDNIPFFVNYGSLGGALIAAKVSWSYVLFF